MIPLKFQLRNPARLLSVADYQARAAQVLPRMIYSFVDGAADDLVTVRANRAAYERWGLRSRVLRASASPDMSVTIAGIKLELPILPAPTGLCGLIHWHGELAEAQMAEQFGTRSVVSTMSSYSPEEIRAGTRERHFFQLYPWARPDADARSTMASFLERVSASQFAGLFVTLDVPVMGNREGERRLGMAAPPIVTPRVALDLMRHPGWCFSTLKHQRVSARIFTPEGSSKGALKSVREQVRLTTAEMQWSDLEWMRTQWRGPLIVKGIMEVDDAKRAIDAGADGIVVSNHGGRQLESGRSSLSALPSIVDAVGDQIPVLFDGGIRRGTDVAKALCLGARAVLVGRPFLYGLAVDGENGVRAVFDIFRSELSRTLALMGVRSVGELDRSWLVDNEATVSG